MDWFILSSSLEAKVCMLNSATYFYNACATLCRHHTEKWHTSNCISHHENACACVSVGTNAFFGEALIPMLPHPPYSHDLAPCDFFLNDIVKCEMELNIEEIAN